MAWYDMIWYDVIWYDKIWYMSWYVMIWYVMIYVVICYDMIWYDIWYDMIWYDVVRYDMIWYDMMIYYIHTEKYSPKSCVVNFDTQMSSSQSEEWTMVFTREKNDTSNQNLERRFFTCEKNDTSNQKHRGVWVSRQNSRLFLQLAERRFDIQREKFYSKSFFSLKKWKTFQKWSWIVSFVSLSIKKTVESRRNNRGRGKNRKRRKLMLCFLSELLCLPFISLGLYWNRPFYLNSLIFNCTFRTNS